MTYPLKILALSALCLTLSACDNNDGDEVTEVESTTEGQSNTQPSTAENTSETLTEYNLQVVEARWKEKRKELKFKLRGKPNDEIVVTGVSGNVMLDSRGLAEYKEGDMDKAPCNIRVYSESSGQVATVAVKGTTADCM
ncbi:MAG: hypothetical protein DHS20C01_12350 [marine bacterium B5-7]|nr:MAG: hypothetical protein DHS20C01_12350 [marine bacterium B5-7]